MPYVKRNQNGKIIALFQHTRETGAEFLPYDSLELAEFLKENDIPLEAIKWELTENDISFIRAIEDLIDVLIAKNIINLTDLPEEVIEKLNFRKRMRAQLRWYDEVIIDTEESTELFLPSHWDDEKIEKE